MKRARIISIVCVAVAMLLPCACREQGARQDEAPREDLAAKRMLQGIWVNADGDDVAFRIKGDTLSYPDTTSQPAVISVYGDTLVLRGSTVVKYPILKLAPHLLTFRNPYGDVVKLVKSNDPADSYFFARRPSSAINQRRLIRRDTLVSAAGKRYHCYVQINPTSYKVMKTAYNDEGVAVSNVYFDNIIHLSIFDGASRLFSKDFRKADFARLVPQHFLQQSVLSDLTFRRADATGIRYAAELRIPDSALSYIVEVTVSTSGTLSMQIL